MPLSGLGQKSGDGTQWLVGGSMFGDGGEAVASLWKGIYGPFIMFSSEPISVTQSLTRTLLTSPNSVKSKLYVLKCWQDNSRMELAV